MSNRITTKDLNKLLEMIAKKTGQAINPEQAKEMGKTNYLYLEYASAYGGYRVVNIGIENGAHYGALGESSCVGRRSAKDMQTRLWGILDGIRMLQPEFV